ncbi:MAG: ABC transporter ATP-binding protein [Candidatus Rokubacteria bacterium]|nr:ABC transporter ATP-binding protein [Candidatus Rokubacteria bacterium]
MSALVELREVTFGYAAPAGRRARAFRLAPLSLTIEDGEVLGVIGPNSAGKTTLIRLLTRVVHPSSGEIRLAGRPLASLSAAALARAVAVVPQELPHAFPFTVAQLVLMGRYPHAPGRYFERPEDRAIARAAMEATGVLALAELPLAELSGGERQRAVLARALAQEPRLLVLDEPTAHLDLRYQAECVGLLRRLNRTRGMTVVLVAHDLNLAAEVCDRLLLLAWGEVARLGPPEQVLEEETLRAVYGTEVIVDKAPSSARPRVQVAWPGAAP